MTRPSRTWLTTVTVAVLALTGCATSASEAPESSAPEASHTMPDGTEMSGAEHGEHGDEAQDAQEPSAAATMICEGQVVTAATDILGLEGSVTPSSAWDAPMLTCTFDVDGAPVVLSVHDVTDAAAGQEHFDALQQSLGAHEIEGMFGLGLPSFSTGDGIVAFLRDGKTLVVDATALPSGFGDGSRTQDGAAYAIASAVLVCWTQHA